MDDPSSGEINKDSVFWICSQTKLVAHACSSLKCLRPMLPITDIFYSLQLAALQLIEKGKLQKNTPVSTYISAFENPIILDDITAKNPSFKPATKVVRVEHLLNFSSGLFYPMDDPIHKITPAYTAPYSEEEDPVGHFYNIIKVSFFFT